MILVAAAPAHQVSNHQRSNVFTIGVFLLAERRHRRQAPSCVAMGSWNLCRS
jgi:hypothetical protein